MQFLTDDVSTLVVCALVSSWLDYCNSLSGVFSVQAMYSTIYFQNSVAGIVPNTSRYISITPVLKKLHCLPTEKFLYTSFRKFLLCIFLLIVFLTGPDTVIVLVIFLLYQSFIHVLRSLLKGWIISLALVVTLLGIHFLVRFVHAQPFSERRLNPTSRPVPLNICLPFSVVLEPFSPLSTETVLTIIVLLHLRVPLIKGK